MIALVWFVRALIGLVQAMPLNSAARLGRACGRLGWWIDRRHRRVAIENLAAAFPERGAAEIRGLARENYLRLGEGYVSAIKTAAMSSGELANRLEWVGAREFLARHPGSIVAAVGHFGNFELFARVADLGSGRTVATTYRALRQPHLNRLLQSVRARSGIRFFERRTESSALRDAMRQGPIVLGLLADQHAGDSGLWLPFLGRPASCHAAPAVFALRYDAPLCVAICYRLALGRWRIEVSPEIPTHDAQGKPREPREITADINRHYEDAIRRDPANWFWVHRRWKPPSPRQRAQMESPAAPSSVEPE